MSWQILQADARTMPLADASVDLIVCSPPYWSLRSYRDGGEHYAGQVGSEGSPQQYVDGLVGMVDGEWRRVLKPCGSMFLNLGDKYAGAGGGNDNTGLGVPRGVQSDEADARGNPRRYRQGTGMARPKSLLGLPWRIALALIDRGWILRSEIVWSKPNGLPESVQDRVRRSHEQVFHFTLQPRYYTAVDRIRDDSSGYHRETVNSRTPSGKRPLCMLHASNPLGRLPGSVWTIPTQPLTIPEAHKQHWDLPDHFAAFPPELVRRIVLGWSPEKVCSVCGQGREPVRRIRDERRDNNPYSRDGSRARSAMDRGALTDDPVRIVGEACACPTSDAPTMPGVILDPMMGTGTTVGVAHKLGRHGIGVDLSHDYCRLARWRVEASGHFDRVEDRTAAERQGVML